MKNAQELLNTLFNTKFNPRDTNEFNQELATRLIKFKFKAKSMFPVVIQAINNYITRNPQGFIQALIEMMFKTESIIQPFPSAILQNLITKFNVECTDAIAHFFSSNMITSQQLYQQSNSVIYKSMKHTIC